MNKEVIYLETEDDITDILTKLQQAEQKLVALVPPKKGTILRSAINMKLVARVAKECEKVVVIVTADPAIVKMAMAARIPVAKTLQSRPVVPTAEEAAASVAAMDVIEEDLLDNPKESRKTTEAPAEMPLEAAKKPSDAPSAQTANIYDFTEESLEEASDGSKKAKKPHSKDKKASKPKDPSASSHLRKWLAIGIPAGIVLILVLVWAFVFAPAATVTVAISSTASNFAENVRFTTDPEAEDLEEGVFFADKVIFEQKYHTDIEATGEEDKGEKAKGVLRVIYKFPIQDYQGKGYKYYIPAGETFTNSEGLVYKSTITSSTISWDGESLTITGCDRPVTGLNGTCVKTFEVPVEAEHGGEKYNISSGARWDTYDNATVTNPTAITGGTTNKVKVVDQKDVDKKKDEILAERTIEGREMLFEDLSKDVVAIENSFAVEASKVEATPAIGDEVGENTTPKLEITAAFSVYVVDRSKIEEYIKFKTPLSEDQRIYTIGDPYFERYTAIEEPARLKAVVKTGPIVSEESIWEKIKGHKTGEVQSLLRSINGVSSVEVRTAYFWVWSIPNNRDKVTINLTVEDQES